MSRRTAAIAAVLLAMLCMRLPAWQEAAPAAGDVPASRAAAFGDGRHTGFSVDIDGWQAAPALRRWLGQLLEREGD
ncbi:hypothetical protein [Frateuria terrea]|uniref:Uncharacterized protein n=1 Tax=Frateuria terrea TaxID=529704 RepID=A0A1H6SC79_9GAMM|nr:hypothetical protein [Frateuria terrea]SEI64416.1 hypothetical protein SAMN04487997_1305 [Frateuria terrea]SFP24590.1 hypothetical protein SAMN02927913_1220 [Frateuria terrea]